MKPWPLPAFLCATFCISAAQAAIITTPTTSANENDLGASSSDLLQTSLLNTAIGGTYSGFGGTGNPDPVFTDGSLGTNGLVDTTMTLEVSTQNPQYTVTYNLDITGAAAGYDIISIDTFTGWHDGRAGQSYDVFYTTVSNASPTLLTSVFNTQTGGGLKVSITDDSPGAVLASGVNSIRFDIKAPGTTQNDDGSVWREIDVFGSATTVPEPSSTALLALGSLALFRRNRR